jgi:hypothetical protein
MGKGASRSIRGSEERIVRRNDLDIFDPKAKHEIQVYGCPLGISATLVQKSEKDGPWQVVQYASRSVSDTEARYSQIELETRAVDLHARNSTYTCTGYRLQL